MNPFTHTLRSRWFTLTVHVGMWVLLYLSATQLGGKAPDLRETNSFAAPAQSPVPVAPLESLFTPAEWPKGPAETNALNLFFTRYFVPPASPTAVPPTTRKVQLTYQGFYQTGDNPRQAILKVAEGFTATRVGGMVTANLFVAEATMQAMTVTNLTGQTNLLPINVTKEIEVPIK
ncbi:MAG TPA: hypothetical protein VN578_20775 [Candidatus Binatia bacterium]|jgi:hypothetical protein|nr:hypothetical protein [Candidatus Binatia bacterium]